MSASLGGLVARHAAQQPEEPAYVTEDESVTWSGYHRLADRFASTLLGFGLDRGDRVAVQLPDGPVVHAAFVGAERAGVVVMGIGHRAGPAEVAHLVQRSGARAVVTTSDAAAAGVAIEHRLVVDEATWPDGPTGDALAEWVGLRAIGPSELVMLNSTSGTTGLPKCVMQTQNRWFYFHRKAAEHGDLSADDVFCSVVPAPFGFGLWTAHYSPTVLGVPCVVMARFDPAGLAELIERERVTVLCAVSTQFIMLLNSPEAAARDLSSLRVLFTGGEAIPYERALEFEERTGAAVLNFYGSNETGMLSGTRLSDPRERRLTSAGRVVPEMQVRLYDERGDRLPGDRGRGVPACRGPATSPGYYDDPAANDQLFTSDGWMRMGDVVTIDGEGWLEVVGRTSDFIIRGGKNISAPAVEAEVATHPAVAVVAAVAAPDPVFGERVAAYVELQPGGLLDLHGLRDHLAARGVSKEWWPEHLVVLDELPRASGGKVAKGELRADAQTRFG